MKKKLLGQYYTTNYKYILQDFIIPTYVSNIIEPFAGNGDLLNFINKDKYQLECYDIDPKQPYITKRDTILNPPIYNGKYIITNPPYLARNKSKNKEYFDKYNVNDLYKCLIKEILINKCIGGILIIPLNFWSSIRISDIELRKLFLQEYDIILINIFEEQVFNDTTYTICSFQFEFKKNNNNLLKITIYPSKYTITTELNDNNNYIIGGDIYNLYSNNKYSIYRLTKNNKNKSNNNLLIKCIDDNNNNKINLSIVDDNKLYIDETPNQSCRTYASFIIEPTITIEQQKKLVNDFNNFLNTHRNKYNSLFLTNYRESKDIARKRISFDLVYKIILHLL
jgi:hypothetical protein